MLWVVDAAAARQMLRARLLRCPDCRGVLRPWATARPRHVRQADGAQEHMTPDRARCASCRRTHVLLPASVVPRHAYGVGIIGSALLARAQGTARAAIARDLDVPAGTVRDWLRAAGVTPISLQDCALRVDHRAVVLPRWR